MGSLNSSGIHTQGPVFVTQMCKPACKEPVRGAGQGAEAVGLNSSDRPTQSVAPKPQTCVLAWKVAKDDALSEECERCV